MRRARFAVSDGEGTHERASVHDALTFDLRSPETSDDEALARQRIAMFDPLLSISDWTANGTVTLGTGSVKLAGMAAESGRISKPFVPGNDAITITMND